MTKILNNKYILYAILCVLLVGIVLTFSVRSMETANADYQDIVNDNTALVNFNQYIQFTDTSSNITKIDNNSFTFSSLSSSAYVNCTIFAFAQNHKYFIKSNFSDNKFLLRNDSTDLHFVNGNSILDFTYENVYINNLYIFSSATAGTYYLSVIDLTHMFGAGNEPNLQQCQQLFVAEYYAYNTGVATSLSGLNSYAQGFNDASSSYTTITTSYDSYAQIFDAGASYFVKQANSNGTSFTGRVGFYLGFTAQAGTSLDISLNYFLVHNTADLQIGYVTNGSFVPLFSGIRDVWASHSSGLGYTAKINITLPVAVSYLYLYSYVSSVNDNPACILGSYDIVYTAYNYQSAIIDAERNGYTRAENLYKSQLESYTSETGTGYQNIYNNGYQDGLNAQISEARKKTYTFTAFLGALFDVPVNTIKSLLDFNFLGFNLKNFVFSLLTLSIVFALIKFILVKSGGDK